MRTLEQPAVSELIHPKTATILCTLGELEILDKALASMGKEPYWTPEYKNRFNSIHSAIKKQIDALEKPAREEKILRQARDILRGRGITEWSP